MRDRRVGVYIAAVVSRGRSGCGGRGGRCVHGADGRSGGWTLTTRSGGRSDERTGEQGGKAADGQADGGGKNADSGADGRTGPTRRRHVNRRKRHGQAEEARTRLRRRGQGPARLDERVGLGLKNHIPRGPLHSWAPSPLASSERECAGCLGVLWGPARFHVKHSYLAPGLICLV